jgi:hypothetical protein
MLVSRAASQVLRSYSPTADADLSAASWAAVAEMWQTFSKWAFDPYRPELHYMRGPGPKWREKHAHAGLKQSTSARRARGGPTN